MQSLLDFQVEYIPEEQLMIALAGKQRQMRLIPVKALDQPADTEWIKVADTKGCLLFATGVMRPTATTSTILSGSFCLCVAVKRQVLNCNIVHIELHYCCFAESSK